MARSDAGFPDDCCGSPVRSVAFRDFLARRFHTACGDVCPGRRGTGNSGLIAIAEPAQEILERTSIGIDDDRIEARFFMGLPSSERSINARIAEALLLELRTQRTPGRSF